ncbi:DHA2 family efflux MFS transporter permease subunit [Rhodoferax sp.]|uniref:DHA2 family efflux MFS transporter permease subunit n=1 Tax=Rhodoferax sp. TaxID=50421 RepID=UPI00374CFB43
MSTPGPDRSNPAADSKAAQRWTLVAAILGSSLAFVDSTVVNVALPAIQRSLNANAAQTQWVVEAYVLFLSSLLLGGGALGDKLGRRRMFMAGAVVFVTASVFAAASASIGYLIAARALQGVGAAFLVPGSLSLISSVFPESERGKAIGTWSAMSGVTAAAGPVLGGFLVDHFSWTWAFLINLPLGLGLLYICATRVPEIRSVPAPAGAAKEPVDLVGTALVTLGLTGVIFALIEVPVRGWSDLAVIFSALLGAASLAVFLLFEARAAAPMLPLRLFQNSNFAGANLLTVFLYGALGGALYFLPLNLVQVQGLGATAAGAALLPMIGILFLLSRWAGTLADTYGPKRPLVIGPCIAATGFAWFAIASVDSNYWATFFPATCLLGLGMSITAAPLTTTVMNAVEPGLSGTASGVNNAVSRAAGLLAIGIFGIVMSLAFNLSLDGALATMALPTDTLHQVDMQRNRLAGIVLPETLNAVDRHALKTAVGTAFVSGFRWTMLISAGLALLSAAAAWRMVGNKSDARTG